MRKAVKNISLMVFMFSVSSAVANWGNEITRDPVVVVVALLTSALIYAFLDAFDD
jgi:hypothetical protein